MALQLTGLTTVYTNQVPYETDILRTNMYRMADISKLAETILGTGLDNPTLAVGGDCTPHSPANFSVDIAPIVIYQTEEYFATDYGVIPSQSNPLYKQGINLDTTNVTGLNPPGISGTNYYLIQAAFLTTDANVVSRPYYNSANPAEPIFNSESDTRVFSVDLSAKVSSVGIPTPDAGHIGLWVVTVPFGASNITSGDIAIYDDAPFITESLTQKISASTAQAGAYSYAEDTGTANALLVAFTPTIEALTTGMMIRVKANASNTAATTIAVNGITDAVKVQTNSGPVACSGGEIIIDQDYLLEFNGTDWILMNPTSSTVSGYVPTGTILPFGGSSAPAGYLMCDNASYLRADYPSLFAVIGTAFGSVDGTHFSVPSGHDRALVGAGGTYTLAQQFGAATSSALLDHAHTFTGTVSVDLINMGGGEADGFNTAAAGEVASNNTEFRVASDPEGSGTCSGTTASAGSGSSFSIVQPSIGVNFIIKT